MLLLQLHLLFHFAAVNFVCDRRARIAKPGQE
jgi:hypothetical protein